MADLPRQGRGRQEMERKLARVYTKYRPRLHMFRMLKLSIYIPLPTAKLGHHFFKMCILSPSFNSLAVPLYGKLTVLSLYELWPYHTHSY